MKNITILSILILFLGCNKNHKSDEKNLKESSPTRPKTRLISIIHFGPQDATEPEVYIKCDNSEIECDSSVSTCMYWNAPDRVFEREKYQVPCQTLDDLAFMIQVFPKKNIIGFGSYRFKIYKSNGDNLDWVLSPEYSKILIEEMSDYIKTYNSKPLKSHMIGFNK